MRCKFFFLFCLLGLLITFSLFAEKKQKPVPLEALQDPKSPSYVPIPYPKTREEIITDLKYAIKKNFAPREGKRSYGQQFQGHTILLKIVEDNPEYYIGKIVRSIIRNHCRADYFFIIDIHEKAGKVVSRIAVEDCGLFAGSRWVPQNHSIEPLMLLQEVKSILKERSKQQFPSLENIKIESIEYEIFFGQSPNSPVLKINTSNGILYMDSMSVIYEIKLTEKFHSLRELDAKLFQMVQMEHDKKPFDDVLIDTMNNEAIYLIKVKK